MDKNEFELKFRAIENEVDNEIDSSDFQDKLNNHIEEKLLELFWRNKRRFLSFN